MLKTDGANAKKKAGKACQAPKTWSDLKGNKNYFELAGGASYQGFKLQRVKLQQVYEGNPGEVRVNEGWSYQESTVPTFLL